MKEAKIIPSAKRSAFLRKLERNGTLRYKNITAFASELGITGSVYGLGKKLQAELLSACDVALNHNGSITVTTITKAEKEERRKKVSTAKERKITQLKMQGKIAAGTGKLIPATTYSPEYFINLDPSSRNVYNDLRVKELVAKNAADQGYTSKSAIVTDFLDCTPFFSTFREYIFHGNDADFIPRDRCKEAIEKYGELVIEKCVNELYWKIKSWIFQWLEQLDKAGVISFETMYTGDIHDLAAYKNKLIEYEMARQHRKKRFSQTEAFVIECTITPDGLEGSHAINEGMVRQYQDEALERYCTKKGHSLTRQFILQNPDLRREYYAVLSDTLASHGIPVTLKRHVCHTVIKNPISPITDRHAIMIQFMERLREREIYRTQQDDDIGIGATTPIFWDKKKKFKYDTPLEERQALKPKIIEFYEEFLCYTYPRTDLVFRTYQEYLTTKATGKYNYH